jgi:hypothetical protein
MKYSNLIFSALSLVTLSLQFKSDSTDATIANYTVPATYTFEKSSVTTVDFSWTNSRLSMLEEMEIH